MSWSTFRAVTAMEGMTASVPADAIVPTLVTMGKADKATATVAAVMTGRAGQAVASKVAVLIAVVPVAMAMTGRAGWVIAGAAAVRAMTVRAAVVIEAMTIGGATEVGTMTPPVVAAGEAMTIGGATEVGTMTPPVVAGTMMTAPQALVAGAIVTVTMQVKVASATVTIMPEMVAVAVNSKIERYFNPPFGGFFSKIKLNNVQDIYS
ncbi:MAG: hypothetical protein WAV81_04570 [Candidatus Competibacter sp.]